MVCVQKMSELVKHNVFGASYGRVHKVRAEGYNALCGMTAAPTGDHLLYLYLWKSNAVFLKIGIDLAANRRYGVKAKLFEVAFKNTLCVGVFRCGHNYIIVCKLDGIFLSFTNKNGALLAQNRNFFTVFK